MAGRFVGKHTAREIADAIQGIDPRYGEARTEELTGERISKSTIDRIQRANSNLGKLELRTARVLAKLVENESGGKVSAQSLLNGHYQPPQEKHYAFEKFPKVVMVDRFGPILDGYCFACSDLSGSDWRGIKSAKDIDARSANLTGANIQQTEIKNSNLTGATLRNAVFQKAAIDNTFLTGVDARGAEWDGVKADLMGKHTRGFQMSWGQIDPKAFSGKFQDCHEIVVNLLLYLYPDDEEILAICEMIMARFITCWHGLVMRINKTYKHRIKDLETAFLYHSQELYERWLLGIELVKFKTYEDWESLQGTRYYAIFPDIIDLFVRNKRRQALNGKIPWK